MIPFISLRDFLEEIAMNLNVAMDEVLEKSKGMPVTFVAPSVELELPCTIRYESNSLQVGPSNAFISNYYGLGNDSKINIHFMLKPRGDNGNKNSRA